MAKNKVHVSEFENHDMMMDPLEETRLKKRYHDLAIRLTDTTRFCLAEVEGLLLIYYKLTRNGPMDRTRFREVLHTTFDMTDDSLMDRIFIVWDRRNTGLINMDDWVIGLSVFLRGTLDEKIDYVFKVYDYLGDKALSYETLYFYTIKSLIRLPSDEDLDEGVRDLADLILKKMISSEGKVTLESFQATVRRLPLMLECLGNCIPCRMALYAFLSTFTLDPKLPD
uniref:EF-hand calcium-binding domain-containing protein 1 n=1 Tax=Timema genevievae TaxID=629358 RepID=A0A7R9JTK5_TIMGE|nr:unnamed protein product [Timema genevievae]